MSNIPNDPVMLLSFVNTALRDHHKNPDDFCKTYNYPIDSLTQKLAAIDYHYDAAKNQFI